MGKETAISWTHHTFNPWWGCEKVSPACAHCYAQTFADRFPASRGLWGKGSARRFQSDKYWNQPLNWDRKAAAAGERRRVFCASMADVFEDREDLIPHRARLFDLIRRTPNLDWLLLTKRPENVREHLRAAYLHWGGGDETYFMLSDWIEGKPPANVWLGTTVENQEMADKRIPELMNIPAKVRFLSCEPLLGPVDLWSATYKTHGQTGYTGAVTTWEGCGVDWVICGGESGAAARPMHPAWARNLRDQCNAANVPFHFKWWGEWGIIQEGRILADSTNPEHRHLTIRPDDRIIGNAHLRKVGTARAGRLLDGVLHDAFPIINP